MGELTLIADILKSDGFQYFMKLRHESPIETKMLLELICWGLKPLSQINVGPYRVDILLNTQDQRKIIIECDGKEFHQDIKKEKERDDYLKNKGYEVYHVNGKTIWNRFELCRWLYPFIENNFSEITVTNKFKESYEWLCWREEVESNAQLERQNRYKQEEYET